MANDNEFSVLKMAEDYASANDMSVDDLFSKPDNTEVDTDNNDIDPMDEIAIDEIKSATEKEPWPDDEVEEKAEEPVKFTPMTRDETPVKKEKKPWTPDAEVLAELGENQGPITFSKDEWKEEPTDHTLKNISDDNAIEGSKEQLNEMDSMIRNIEIAKRRWKIIKLEIPQGPYDYRIRNAASDDNSERAQAELDKIFDELLKFYPDNIQVAPEQAVEMPVQPVDQNTTDNNQTDNPTEYIAPDINQITDTSDKDVKIIIDKSAANTIAWNEEELAKVRKSRSIELNIVEGSTIEFGEIEDADDNMVDRVLAPYQRKMNDSVASLPASRYRATFTGLTYTEVLDLSNSEALNSNDLENKRWSIAFDHIKNPSIGPWEEYKYYIDPNTKKKVKLSLNDPNPIGIDTADIHIVTKFDDFMSKTSFIDLSFILWKILCATSMEKEIISVTCRSKVNGKECGSSYDWVYSPRELLDMNNIDAAVLEEMKVTGEATGDDIIDNYNKSPLNSNDTVTLPTSKFVVQFGHISARKYLDDYYDDILYFQQMDENSDPDLFQRHSISLMLTIIKAFLIPKEDGSGYVRINTKEGLHKVIASLDEIDYKTIVELAQLMMNPYTFQFSMKNLVCPKCQHRSTLPIRDISELLFIIARTLESVQVRLRTK